LRSGEIGNFKKLGFVTTQKKNCMVGKTTLLLEIEISGPSSNVFVVRRGKNWKMPTDKQDMATMMELELTALMMGYADVVKFWKEKQMLNEEAAAGMMAVFIMENVRKPENAIMENIPDNFVERLQKTDHNSVMKILKGDGL